MPAAGVTALDLLVLGLLQDRPMHGYELHQHVRAERIDEWFDVSMAGIYYSLAKLRDLDLVIESRQRHSSRSSKATYHVTDAGRTTFFQSLEKMVASQSEIHFEYDLSIYLLNRLPRTRAHALLLERAEFLARWAERVDARIRGLDEQCPSPHLSAILDHTKRYVEMEMGWVSDVMHVVQEGSAGSPSERLAAGLMILAGNLHEFHLPDLIRLIASGKHTGTLMITDEALTRTIGFMNGRPHCISSTRRADADASSVTLQEHLDAIFDLFRWQEGRFSFNQSLLPSPSCLSLDLSAEELILSGSRWVDNWGIIQRLVPSSETVYEVGMGADRIAKIDFLPNEKRILDRVDGLRDLATIARELGLTIFEASRSMYSLAAINVVRSADLDRIRLRRAFREIAELMCSSTFAWRTSAEDRMCEREVNACCAHLPLRMIDGRIADQTDPGVRTEDLVAFYKQFLRSQIGVVSTRFSRENARHSFRRSLEQLVPELQEVAQRHGFHRLLEEA